MPIANKSQPRVAISWHGLPQYAARLIRRAIDLLGGNCIVIGSKPEVPVLGMETVLNQRIHWLDPDLPQSWSQLGLEIPEIFVQSGWSFPAFSHLGSEVKRNGGIVIGLSDANWRNDFRQFVLGPIFFRLILRKRFDAFIVPGKEGQKVLSWFGMSKSKIYTGMYAADPVLFSPGPPLCQRKKQLLYVGQFIHRKNIILLCQVFLYFSKLFPEWTLKLCGHGELLDEIPRDSRIIIEPFVQPEELEMKFHESRFFVLPSKEEAWGLVVHEACLTGTALLLSDAVGSAPDLLCDKNGFVFRRNNFRALLNAMVAAASVDETWLAQAHGVSLTMGANFSPDHFAKSISEIIDHF